MVEIQVLLHREHLVVHVQSTEVDRLDLTVLTTEALAIKTTHHVLVALVQ